MKFLNRTMKNLILLAIILTLVGCTKPISKELAEPEVNETQVNESNELQANELNESQSNESLETSKEEDLEEVAFYPYEFVDKFGNTVIIEKEPTAIVSFSPELTEILYALGKGADVVGRSSYCDYPSEALGVKDMGSLFDFSLEILVDTKPDLVFLSSMVSEDVYTSIIEQGIQVAVFDNDQTLMGTVTMINQVGQIVNKSAEAEEINGTIIEAIEAVKARAKNRTPKSVYFAISVGEYTSAATGDTFIGDIITAIGATNVAQDGTFWMYTVEQLVEKDPDFVICSQLWDTKATIESLDGYKDLTAVKEGRLIEADENIFSRQGPRVVEAIYTLEKIVYGD